MSEKPPGGLEKGALSSPKRCLGVPGGLPEVGKSDLTLGCESLRLRNVSGGVSGVGKAPGRPCKGCLELPKTVSLFGPWRPPGGGEVRLLHYSRVIVVRLCMKRWSEQRAERRGAGEARTRRGRSEAAKKSEQGTSSKLVRLYKNYLYQ